METIQQEKFCLFGRSQPGQYYAIQRFILSEIEEVMNVLNSSNFDHSRNLWLGSFSITDQQIGGKMSMSTWREVHWSIEQKRWIHRQNLGRRNINCKVPVRQRVLLYSEGATYVSYL